MLIARELGGLRDRVVALIDGTDTLDSGLRSPYRLLVVGPSQAGKSTLINVIAGYRLLPTTGAGDAKTLKETVLTYSSAGEQTLRVRYITKREANQRRFALERYARHLPDAATAFVKPWNETDMDAAPDDRRAETLMQQIRTVIYPELRDHGLLAQLPDVDRLTLDSARPADWVDAWRMLLAQDTVAGARYATVWRPRIDKMSALLGLKVEFREPEIGTPEFRRQIERHTAEGLAFLVDRVELALPGKNLAYMDVEDLPGVGVFGDPAANVALDVLTNAMSDRDLDGLLVVTRQSGLDQETANLVGEAAVLKRVLQGETDLGIAVTHVDAIAAQRAQEMEDRGEPVPASDDLLRVVGAEAATRQLAKLEDLLRRESDNVEEPERTARIDKVLERTRVVGIEASAAEAHRFNLAEKKRRAFASSLEGTGVPDLIAHFFQHAADRHRLRLARVVEQAERVHDWLRSELERIVRDNDVAEAQQLAAAARDAYLAALKESQLPLSNRWTAVREGTRTRLEHGIPAILPRTQANAQKEANKKKRSIIRGCETAGPNGGMVRPRVLEAALRRGGAWDGAHRLDLPGDLAQSLMPELLKGWRTVAADVEVLLTEYAAAASQLLGDLDASAREAATRAGLPPNSAIIADARKNSRSTRMRRCWWSARTLTSSANKCNSGSARY